MESSKLVVKFYLEDESKLAHDQIVPVFHSWIQFHSIRDHLLIDVADYAHVPNGPGIVLVSHEANIYLDDVDGRWGVTYSRKTPIAGTFTDRLRTCFGTALEAAQLLEENAQLGGIKFRANEASFKINDRLLAPNTSKTFAAVKPQLEKFAAVLFAGNVTLEHRLDPKRLFEIAIKSSSSADLATLAVRLNEQKAVVAE